MFYEAGPLFCTFVPELQYFRRSLNAAATFRDVAFNRVRRAGRSVIGPRCRLKYLPSPFLPMEIPIPNNNVLHSSTPKYFDSSAVFNCIEETPRSDSPLSDNSRGKYKVAVWPCMSHSLKQERRETLICPIQKVLRQFSNA